MKEFAEHGFAGASTRAVAAAAGVQHPLVNYHFKSKEGLWHAVLEATAGQFMDQFQARLAGLRGVDDVTKLRLVQEDFIRFSAENPHFHLLMSQAGQHPSKQLNALVNEFVRPYFADDQRFDPFGAARRVLRGGRSGASAIFVYWRGDTDFYPRRRGEADHWRLAVLGRDARSPRGGLPRSILSTIGS